MIDQQILGLIAGGLSSTDPEFWASFKIALVIMIVVTGAIFAAVIWRRRH